MWSPSIREHRHAKFARPAIGDLHFVAFIMRQMDVITRKYQRTLACTIRCFCGFAFRLKTYPEIFDSRVRRLSWSLGRLLRVIERMDRLNLSVYDVNPVKNVIDSIHRLHVEDSCNVVSLDDVLL